MMEEGQCGPMLSTRSFSIYNIIGTECAICFQPYTEGDVISLSQNKNCNHFYHIECMVTWLSDNHDSCPSCRQNYLKEEDEVNDPTEIDVDYIASDEKFQMIK